MTTHDCKYFVFLSRILVPVLSKREIFSEGQQLHSISFSKGTTLLRHLNNGAFNTANKQVSFSHLRYGEFDDEKRNDHASQQLRLGVFKAMKRNVDMSCSSRQDTYPIRKRSCTMVAT